MSRGDATACLVWELGLHERGTVDIHERPLGRDDHLRCGGRSGRDDELCRDLGAGFAPKRSRSKARQRGEMMLHRDPFDVRLQHRHKPKRSPVPARRGMGDRAHPGPVRDLLFCMSRHIRGAHNPRIRTRSCSTSSSRNRSSAAGIPAVPTRPDRRPRSAPVATSGSQPGASMTTPPRRSLPASPETSLNWLADLMLGERGLPPTGTSTKRRQTSFIRRTPLLPHHHRRWPLEQPCTP